MISRENAPANAPRLPESQKIPGVWAQTVPILLYHSVSVEATPRYRPYVLAPDQFEAHLVWLRSAGYTSITVTELAEGMAGARTLPSQPIALTFDDGLADFQSHALPLLQRHGFRATLYVTTGFVGRTAEWLAREGEHRRPMMTWDQIAALPEQVIECGAHSQTHPQLDTLSRHAAQAEIAGSKAELERQLGQPVHSFAYPHGYHDSTVRDLVRQSGYTSACAVKDALSRTSDDPFTLARVVIGADTRPVDLAGRLLGPAEWPARQGEPIRARLWRVGRRMAGRAGWRLG